MGKTNRLCGNERKLSLLIGEQQRLLERIAAAEKVISELDSMRARIAIIAEEIELGERWIKVDHPEWTGAHLRPKIPHIHDSPIRFGNGSRLALAIIRESHIPLSVREIVIEACRREGHADVDSPTIDRLTRTVGNALVSAQRRDAPIDHDHGWPRRWFSMIESN